jgi:uncharacterized protein (TIGR02145 family)
MKKSAIVILFLLAMLKTQAQDYLISFAGTGASTTVDSMQVRNLTQNTSLTLYGTDVLHLMLVVGINPASESADRNLRIYPNPMNENSFIEFETASQGNTTIELFDVAGKQVAQTQNLLQGGRHTFAISGLSSGIYTLSIKSPDNVYSGKIVCTSSTSVNGKISYVSTHLKSADHGRLKSNQSLIPMQYNNGDQLLFTCFSGIYSTVIPLVPTQSQTVTSNFIACTDADGNNYATVTVGTQTWMAVNLNVGVRIDGIQDQTDNGIIEKYCFNNDESNCDTYGGLYQWYEIMKYSSYPGVQGICPTGWHLPTVGEWNILSTFLGGTSLAGGKMKATGTLQEGTGLWETPNAGATNESGFTAVPGGWMSSEAIFWFVGLYARWWSSTQCWDDSAWFRYVLNSDSSENLYSGYFNEGISGRCLKDGSITFPCGPPITINHVAGDVAPINKTVTYGTVTNIPGEESKCWITSNLGADHQATAVDDVTEASAGWYWQFNRKQGYKHDGTTRQPNTIWINAISENSDWIAANDPCSLELGSGWRIPTSTEWTNVDVIGNWHNWNGPWNSGLKLHAAGYLYYSDGSLNYRGSAGSYWSSIQLSDYSSRILFFTDGNSIMFNYKKGYGFPLHCIKDN